MPKLASRNEELIARHNEIWALMGLSARIGSELNAVVLRINAEMPATRAGNPEVYDKVFKDSKRAETVTYDVYLNDHLRRWTLLGLSDDARRELLAAADFCWTALHRPEVPLSTADREKAEVIRRMMKELGGPPPCCDEKIIETAKATVQAAS